MERKDIELFGEIQTCLQDYCRKVLATFVKDFPEVGISEFDRIVGIDILGELLQLTYTSFPYNRSIFIPIQYIEAEDVDGFCSVYAEKIRKYGKTMREDEFIEKAYHNHWMKFYELFDIRMTDSEEDLDRARNKLHGLIETMTYVLLLAKKKEKTGDNAEIFTEKELPSLNVALINFLEWARADRFWATREKDYMQRAKELKAELIVGQEELIQRIKENEYHTEEELRMAETALEAIKKSKC